MCDDLSKNLPFHDFMNAKYLELRLCETNVHDVTIYAAFGLVVCFNGCLQLHSSYTRLSYNPRLLCRGTR